MIRKLALALLLSFTVSTQATNSSENHTFVIVHGATGGGWDWKKVSAHLISQGHIVYRPTLTGLGERQHLANKDIDLSTHINDIVNTILFEDLHDVVLVGHSYGGMVITGVINEIPERVHHLTFLDAMVPNDGMSMLEEMVLPENDKIVDGQIVFSWVDLEAPFPRDVPHPHKSFTEKVSYSNPIAKKIDATYVAFIPEDIPKEQREKTPSWQRAIERNWTIRTFDGNHIIYREKPAEIADLIEATANDKNSIK